MNLSKSSLLLLLITASPAFAEKLDMLREDWQLQSRQTIAAANLDTFVQRRTNRLKKLSTVAPAIVFLENTEPGNAPRLNMSLSDGPYRGKPFTPGAAIKRLAFDSSGKATVDDLLQAPTGMIRDLDVSYDGKRILFSWKKSIKDDYHIYEMVVATKKIRPVTKEPGVADIQASYLDKNRIVFHSTRCVNVVDCNESIDVVNLFTCDLLGGDITRLGFDQVSTQYPSVLTDGRIVYTRWDYNDRGQIFPQGLFTMNPDGTQQKAFYGNNSYYPTSLIQARSIPGTQQLLAIASGHHTPPCGKLVTVDTSHGTEEGKGIQLVAPQRQVEPKRIDKADQNEALFQYPYPLSANEYLVGYSLLGKKSSRHFAIYWMNQDGERELLAWHPQRSYRHPMPLVPRAIPAARPSLVDHSKDFGTFFIDNIYIGEGLKGVPKGTIKRLRVIGLEFRAAAVGTNHNRGEGGHARVCTPISLSGAWDIKRVLGDAKVYEDGSASFQVPAQTALYFQPLDKNGHAVQSMRSWATLQPGESSSCTGCHDTKSYAPAVSNKLAKAMRPQQLEPFYGPARGFSFLKEVQPILDKHCVQCHQGEVYSSRFKGGGEKSFSLTSKPVHDRSSKRAWTESYISLLQARPENGRGVNEFAKSNSFINWISPQSGPTVRKPYSFGAAKSPMIAMLAKGHPNGKGKRRTELSQEEMDKIACWIDLAVPFCGDYREANTWSQQEKAWYQHQLNKQKRLSANHR